ncbi:MAG: alkyl hydroperoxide reductase [endosymbiont of Escarpia spicata]|uniref:Alkyl hydroperoxide reductase n=1 Tax=endosymbiont of Escarpia spicata TaxID=2200908 RepID=A0A370DRM8_9GAMM|nr:MAG: alkyl hydroperoxide reductase [endosymbiont of Escarpia spicata]
MIKRVLQILLIGSLLAGAWFAGHVINSKYSHVDRTSTSSPIAHLPAYRLVDLAGKAHHTSQWSDKVVILNFWASWCPPCQTEMPALSDLQDEWANHGLQILGIAIDKVDDAKTFSVSHPVSYPLFRGGMTEAKLSKRMGNRLLELPFTAAFGRDGQLIFAQAGAIPAASLRKHIEPML